MYVHRKNTRTSQNEPMVTEKLLVTSNFSFSHNVFHSYVSLVRQNAGLRGNGLRVGTAPIAQLVEHFTSKLIVGSIPEL